MIPKLPAEVWFLVVVIEILVMIACWFLGRGIARFERWFIERD